ncbi:phenylacetate--CoA ligase, partial [Vibrio vulnificus]
MNNAEDPQFFDRERIEELQLARLQQTVHYAYDRVPLYQRKFDAAGVKPSDLRTLDDLALFPYTTK